MKYGYWIYIFILFSSSCVCGRTTTVIGSVENKSNSNLIVFVSSCSTIDDKIIPGVGTHLYVMVNSQEELVVDELYSDSCNWYFYFLDSAKTDSLFAEKKFSINEIYKKSLIGYKVVSYERVMKKNINFSIDTSLLVHFKK
jgi:hypothetical protein